jgi:hypothetical protein
VDAELNQGQLRAFQKALSERTAKLRTAIADNDRVAANRIVKKFDKEIYKPYLAKIKAQGYKNVDLPKLTLSAPTSKTLGGGKGRLAELAAQGLDFEKFYKREGFGYQMPRGVLTQKELLGQSDKQIRTMIEKIGCPGLAAGGRASFQDGSTCYSRGMDKIKTGEIKTPAEKSNFSKLAKMTGGLKKLGSFLFGPVEMGTLPLFIAAEGLYTNYANKRDLKKALDRVPISEIPQYKKDLILEGYRQEARDIGDVGLETYAIDKPNVSGALEKIGLGDKKQMMDLSGGLISGIREVEAAEEAERYRKLYPEAQKEKFDVSKPMFKSGGKVDYDNYLPGIDDDK